jgi:hypothetical protein
MESPLQDPPDAGDLLAAAHQLAALLGLSTIQGEALLRGELNLNKQHVKTVEERPVNIKRKEYILIRETTCLTCSTTSKQMFHMKQLGHRPALLAEEIFELPIGIKASTETHTVITCSQCKENLLLLPKSELILLYLEEVQKGRNLPLRHSFDELEAKYQELHPPKVKKHIKEESEND